MKNAIAIFGILLVLVFVSTKSFAAVNKNVAEAKIKTSAVCESCKSTIEKGVNKLDGIVKSNLNLDDKVLTVSYDKTKLTLDQIKDKVKSLGYDADDVKRDVRAYKKLPKCCKKDG